MPYRRLAREILADWREAERDLALAPEGSVEAMMLEQEIIRLRNEYQRLVLDARGAGTPEPPAFPTKP